MDKNIVAIIQARTGSTRLPNKINLDLWGKTVLQRVVNRVSKSRHLETVVLAMPNTIVDSRTLREMDTPGYLGRENDVLNRYWKCARQFNADIIVRITADCPLIDPHIIDRTIGFFLNRDYDYVSNRLERPGYPDGQDVEVFRMEALDLAEDFARDKSDREHVTPYIKRHLRCGALHSYSDFMDVRMTLDTWEDYGKLRDTVGKLIEKHGEMVWNLKDIMEVM
jgi:spore coat polysaccharide biosynthesis protein SpsF (cytidylyltransferase family)